MQKEAATDSRPRIAGQLALAAMALPLTAVLAACAVAIAPPSAQVGSASQAAAGSARSSAPSSAAAGTASHADVIAAASRVKCPDLDGAVSPSGRRLRARPIPAGFRPVAVIECIAVPAIVPVDGTQPMVVRRVAFSGLGRLVAVLRLPSALRTRGLVPACLPPVAALPWIVFIGPGDHLLRPRIPIGACGLAIVPVQVSLRSLRWRTLSTSKRSGL